MKMTNSIDGAESGDKPYVTCDLFIVVAFVQHAESVATFSTWVRLVKIIHFGKILEVEVCRGEDVLV